MMNLSTCRCVLSECCPILFLRWLSIFSAIFLQGDRLSRKLLERICSMTPTKSILSRLKGDSASELSS